MPLRLGRTRLELARSNLWLYRRHRALNATVGLDRTLRGHHRRAPTIRAIELLPILCCLLSHLQLRVHRRKPGFASRRQLRGPRPNLDSSATAVVGDPGVVDVGAIHHHGAAVHIPDARDIHTCHGAVVEEAISSPVTTVETIAGVPEAIVDSAIEADVSAPVSAMVTVAAAVEAPITRGP